MKLRIKDKLNNFKKFFIKEKNILDKDIIKNIQNKINYKNIKNIELNTNEDVLISFLDKRFKIILDKNVLKQKNEKLPSFSIEKYLNGGLIGHLDLLNQNNEIKNNWDYVDQCMFIFAIFSVFILPLIGSGTIVQIFHYIGILILAFQLMLFSLILFGYGIISFLISLIMFLYFIPNIFGLIIATPAGQIFIAMILASVILFFVPMGKYMLAFGITLYFVIIDMIYSVLHMMCKVFLNIGGYVLGFLLKGLVILLSVIINKFQFLQEIKIINQLSNLLDYLYSKILTFKADFVYIGHDYNKNKDMILAIHRIDINKNIKIEYNNNILNEKSDKNEGKINLINSYLDNSIIKKKFFFNFLQDIKWLDRIYDNVKKIENEKQSLIEGFQQEFNINISNIKTEIDSILNKEIENYKKIKKENEELEKKLELLREISGIKENKELTEINNLIENIHVNNIKIEEINDKLKKIEQGLYNIKEKSRLDIFNKLKLWIFEIKWNYFLIKIGLFLKIDEFLIKYGIHKISNWTKQNITELLEKFKNIIVEINSYFTNYLNQLKEEKVKLEKEKKENITLVNQLVSENQKIEDKIQNLKKELLNQIKKS